MSRGDYGQRIQAAAEQLCQELGEDPQATAHAHPNGPRPTWMDRYYQAMRIIEAAGVRAEQADG